MRLSHRERRHVVREVETPRELLGDRRRAGWRRRVRERATDRDGVNADVLEEAAILRRDRRLEHPRGDAIDGRRDPDAGAHVALENVPVGVEDDGARHGAARLGRVEWSEPRVRRQRQRHEADGDDEETCGGAHGEKHSMTSVIRRLTLKAEVLLGR